jgi:hypothetical protein
MSSRVSWGHLARIRLCVSPSATLRTTTLTGTRVPAMQGSP